MDTQPGMLRRAQEIAQAANLDNIGFLQASMGDGQLAVGRADRALLVTVLGEIPNREAALGELFATLKPGGILSVTEIIFDSIFRAGTQSSVWLARLDSERRRSLGIAWRSP